MLHRLIQKEKQTHNYVSDEFQYLNLIKYVLAEGKEVEGRNGKTLTVFGDAMIFDLRRYEWPLLTTKKVAWKTCAKELFWFIKGHTDNSILQKQNVKIWNDNASKEFLEARGLDYKENDLGPVYGHQWRYFNAKYIDCKTDYSNKGVDQLANVIKILKDPKERHSRRILMSAWNPCQIEQMALPPCHVLVQFNVIKDELSCSLYQRSGDIGLGVPFNIASYTLLTFILCKHCDLKPGYFNYHLGNCHIYDDHIDALKKQLENKELPFPKINIISKHDNIEEYSLEDMEVSNYLYSNVIEMKMRK